MKTNFQSFKCFLLVSPVLLLLITNTVTCRPSTRKTSRLQSIGFQKAFDVIDPSKRYAACNADMDLNELCERCMKITEGEDVFGMCCSNEDSAQEFCKDYVFFGIT